MVIKYEQAYVQEMRLNCIYSLPGQIGVFSAQSVIFVLNPA